jgi:putative tryptophan/tyrosine transport system substrate-binding protein
MKRRPFVGLLALWPWSQALVAPALFAQVTAGRYTLGYLDQGSIANARDPGNALTVLLKALSGFGYVEGRNLEVEARFADGRPEDLSALAMQLVQARPQVIAMRSAGLAEKVLEHTESVPVVALSAGQLEAVHGVQSIRRPGGNLTGMQVHSPELIGKRLQLLKEIVPGLQRVAVLRGVPFDGPGYHLYRDANEAAAARLGIRARYLQFRTEADLEALFSMMANERDQAVLVWGNPHLNLHRPQIAELALRTRMPVLYDVRYPGVPSNELMLYGPNVPEVWREAATYVDRIFCSARPGDLPIGQARVFELVINLRVAKAIGLTIPKSVLLRADEVIQ